MMSVIAIPKQDLRGFCTRVFDFDGVLAHDSRQFLLSSLLMLQVHSPQVDFPLITYFRYHVTEYHAVIGTHSMVWGNKLLYGHVPGPFPLCGTGSGHARLGICVHECLYM